MVSRASCGMRTGWDDGQAPAATKPPLTVLYMWSWWLGLSRFLPSQQLDLGASVSMIAWYCRGLFGYSRGEVVDGHDAGGAWLGREVVGLTPAGHDVCSRLSMDTMLGS